MAEKEKAKQKADMSEAAKKAWATRKESYGESGMSKEARAKMVKNAKQNLKKNKE